MNADIILVIRSASLRGAPVKALRQELRQLAAPGRRLILHMAGVESMDTTGAATILEIGRTLKANGGALKLVGLQNKVSAFLELLRVNRDVEIYAGAHATAAFQVAA